MAKTWGKFERKRKLPGATQACGHLAQTWLASLLTISQNRCEALEETVIRPNRFMLGLSHNFDVSNGVHLELRFLGLST